MNMRKATVILFGGLVVILPIALLAGAERQKGDFDEDAFERPAACRQCHVDIYQQWDQAMMSKSYTHHWDEIEYFELALRNLEQDPSIEDVVAGCNGCHAPVAWMTGTRFPPRPGEGSRADEGVSCDLCHTVTGTVEEDIPYNYSYRVDPGRTKYGNREGAESPHHDTERSEFVQSAEFCANCHNEQSPHGVWVKSTQIEWKEGPYGENGVECHVCHMPAAPGRNANTAKEEHPDIAQHLFHGAHDPGKVRGSIEMRMHADRDDAEPGFPIKIEVQLFNGKCGHMVPSGSAEERQLWLTVTALAPDGRVYHLPVDRKGFEGEEHTITSNEPAYQDIGEMRGESSFEGLPRDAVEHEGDRIFCLPYFDPQGRRTMAQWNTASLGTDYRIGPRETKIETYTWNVPGDMPEGRVVVKAELKFRLLVKSVADYLGVPEEETEIIMVNDARTEFEVIYY